MNEVVVGWVSGQSNMTANVFQPDGSVRELNVVLTENVTGGQYIGDCLTIQNGDSILAYHNGVYIGSEEYDSSQAGALVANVLFIKNVVEGDRELDVSGVPWNRVVKIKGTTTELVRKKLLDVVGSDLEKVSTVIGQEVEP